MLLSTQLTEVRGFSDFFSEFFQACPLLPRCCGLSCHTSAVRMRCATYRLVIHKRQMASSES